MARISGTSSYIYFETDIFPGLAITEENPGLYATAYGLLADFVRAVRNDALRDKVRGPHFSRSSREVGLLSGNLSASRKPTTQTLLGEPSKEGHELVIKIDHHADH